MTRGQSTGSTTQRSWAGRPQPCEHAEHRSPIVRAVVEHRERQLELIRGLPDRDDLVTDLAEHAPAALGERLATEACERLGRAEAIGRAADEQDAGGR